MFLEGIFLGFCFSASIFWVFCQLQSILLGTSEIPNSADPCLYVYQVHPLGGDTFNAKPFCCPGLCKSRWFSIITSSLFSALRMPTTTSSKIETWRSEARFYRFLVQSSGCHLRRFQDIQGRFTVSKSK